MTDDAPRPALDAAITRAVWIIYTNWKGETGRRYIRPGSLFYGTSPWHRKPQWLLEAWDVERSKQRTFALAGIHGWAETSEAFDALLAAASRAEALERAAKSALERLENAEGAGWLRNPVPDCEAATDILRAALASADGAEAGGGNGGH